MSTQKEDLLKSIRSFISADNNLAIKEAEHQIVIFKAILEKEVALFQEESEKTDEDNSITLTDPKQEEINVDILNAIEEFNKNQQKKKAAKEKSEKEKKKPLTHLAQLCGTFLFVVVFRLEQYSR